MKKIIILIFLMTCMLSYKAAGQAATASIGDLNAAPAEQLIVPVEVTGFNNVEAISLFFEYDPDVVTFSGSENPAISGMTVNGSLWGDGKYRVGITWSETPGTTIDGKLVDVVFDYQGGSSDFTWTQAWCEVEAGEGPLTVIYTDGSVSPVGTVTVTIPDQPEKEPGPLSIPINVDFSNVADGVGSFTFVIPYDESKLEFQNISDASLIGIDVFNLSEPNRIVLEWINDPEAEEGSFLNGTLLNLNFDYLGGNTPLVFDEPNCAMSNNEAIEVSVLYEGGMITQHPGSMITVSLPDILEDPGTDGVEIPLTVTNFNSIASFDLVIDFDPVVIDFVGLANFHSSVNESQFETHVSGTSLGISWVSDPDPITIENDKLFDIVFDYSSGFSALAFSEQDCVVTDDDFNTKVVVYEDGSISEDITFEASATIPNLLANIAEPVYVPIYVTGFKNLGAIYFEISFDDQVLEFVDIVDLHEDLDLADASFNSVDGTLFFDWENPDLEPNSGPDIPDDDPIFYMRFNFNGGTSALSFNHATCAVSRSDEEITPIIVSYTDGSVFGGIVSLIESSISVDPDELEVGESSTITIQLRDQLGNDLPASGGVVTMTTTLGHLSPVTDNNDGTYTAELTSDGSGTATITATLNGDYFLNEEEETEEATVRFYYILTLELDGCGTYTSTLGWVRINGTDYDQSTQQISISTATVTLESVTEDNWQLYSWKEDGVVETPRGASTYTLTMDQDKTVVATFHLPGDANGDGVVTTADILIIVNYLKDLNPSPFCFENADANRDGSITTADILTIVNIIKGE